MRAGLNPSSVLVVSIDGWMNQGNSKSLNIWLKKTVFSGSRSATDECDSTMPAWSAGHQGQETQPKDLGPGHYDRHT